MSTHSNHPYHLVDQSPWPLTGAFGAMTTLCEMAQWFHQYNMNLLSLGFIITMLTMIKWWRDVTREFNSIQLKLYSETGKPKTLNTMKWTKNNMQ